jgi:hypothetical protein
MKTSTTAIARPTSALGARLRRFAVVGLVAPVVALAACSGEPAVTADPPAPTGTGTSAATPSTSATDTATTSAVPTATATALPKRTDTAINKTITDPILGHKITATRIARNLPWPKGNPVSQEQFELVGVFLDVQAGSRYSADVYPWMFTLRAAPTNTYVQSTQEFNTFFGGSLTAATRGQDRKGWVFFKMDRGSTGPLTLAFHRPAYQVSNTGKAIPKQAFGVQVTT